MSITTFTSTKPCARAQQAYSDRTLVSALHRAERTIGDDAHASMLIQLINQWAIA